MQNEKLDLILTEIQGIKQEQQEMKQDIQGIKQEQQEMKQDIQGIKQDQQEMKEEQQTMKQEQLDMKAQMNSRFDTIETILAVHSDKIKVMDENLNVVQKEVTNHTKSIEEIRKMQHQQEKIIDILSRRSLDQEADIKMMHT